MNCHYSRFLFLLIVFCSSVESKAQYIEEFSISPSNGDKMLEIKNYQEAVRQFEALLAEEENNLEYKYKLGKSYNYSFIDRKKGLEILKELSGVNKKPDGTDYELGVAYYKNYQFQDAIKVFNQLILVTDDPTEKEKLINWVRQCKRSEEMQSNPVPIVFENLGKEVNSEAPDFLPLVKPDESSIIYSTKRNGVVGNLFDFSGYKTSDIFISKHKRNKYSRARSIGNPNSYGNEYTAGSSENGNYLVYNVNSEEYFNDLFVSEMGRRSFMPPKVFDSDKVNQKSAETGGTLTNDGEKMYFSSDRAGGLGGFDIYWVQRLPNGEWGIPKNMGAPINTVEDEKYPLLMKEGNRLYFSSNGHLGMGDLDLFYSDLKDKSWSMPINLGYPINTVDDDLNISFSKNGRHAYVSAKREDSFGDLDIYRITFLEKKERNTLIEGIVMNQDSSLIERDITIEIFNNVDKRLEGIYKVSRKTGKFLAALPPGRYTIEITNVNGFKNFTQNMKLLGKNDFKTTQELSILLNSE